MSNQRTRRPILSGLRVLDISHQYAAGNTCAILADFGADVLHVEHPEGSPVRTMLPKKGAHSMWWKVAQRGKKHITLNLSTPKGRDILLRLAKDFDLLVENFRPGTLERWGLGPADLEKAGLNLTMVRISGFGQTGPYSPRPGFGTVAEALSGFAHMNGEPDGPPTFPSTTLADGVASLWGVIGAMTSLYANLRDDTRKGVEVVDVALFEGLFRIVPTQIPTYQQNGVVQTRPGNYLGDHGALRNTWRTRDNKFYVAAAVGPAAVRKVLVGAGATELVEFLDSTKVMYDVDPAKIEAFLWRCNEHMIAWSGRHDWAEVTAALTASDAVHSPVYSAAEIMDDPHYQAREDLVTLPDDDLGPITMQGIVPKFPGREHKIRHPGRAKGYDNQEVYASLGITGSDLSALKREGIV
ncbi:MAG TPA: CoA transferase [Ramlibacter sp.]|nr:CoA transferase [Ramlibacter sp.]